MATTEINMHSRVNICKGIRVRCRQTLMTYIQKDNIYTNIQEMLKCEVHLNNIEKQKACLVLVVLVVLQN